MIKDDDKPTKKLKLDIETLRILDNDELTGVQGGWPSVNSVSISISVQDCPKCCGCNG